MSTSIPSVKRHWYLLVVFVVLVFIGSIYSLWDYRRWWHLEWDAYGDGWSPSRELAAPLALSNSYRSNWGFRIKYPDLWDAQEKLSALPKAQRKMAYNQANEIVTFTHPFARAKVTVFLWPKVTDYTQLKDKLREGENQEQQNINTDTVSLFITTRQTSDEVIQNAIGSKNDLVIQIQTTTPLANWQAFSKTFLEIYKSVVML